MPSGDMMELDAAPPSNTVATLEHTATPVTRWENLTVSPDALVLVRYTAQRMQRSRAGGRNWSDVASGVGHIASAVARDDDTVFVVRHEADTAMLYVRDEHELRTHTMPRGFVARALTRHGDVYGLVDGAVTRWRAADGWHTSEDTPIVRA